jgi:hypothetical protein
MSAATDRASKSMGRIVYRWVLLMPLIVACVAVGAFVLVGWLGDGTLASLYEVEYFMPLPLYCVAVFLWVFPPMVLLGLVVAGVWFIRSKFARAE